MRVIFDPAASEDLDRIFGWITKDNPRAAFEMISRIEARVMRLAAPEVAFMGRLGLIDGTRELIERPYIIVYRVDEARDQIVIISIVHGARDRENQF
jgi:toxin ParE1/3/4